MSSTYVAPPVISRGSSVRLILSPTILLMSNSSRRGSRRLLSHLRSGILDRADDVLVSGAAAEIPFQGMADFRISRIRVALEELVGGHNHARRAEPALKAVLFPKALLDGME